MIFTVSQAYKGKIFSFLANGLAPYFPREFAEMVDTSYLKVTFSSARNVKGSYSILQEAFLRNSNQTSYQKLNSTLLWCSYNLVKFAEQVFGLNYIPSYKANFTDASAKITPTNIVAIDYNRYIDALAIILSTFISGSVVSSPVPVPGYSLVTPWEVRRNFFHPIFLRLLSHYYESGLPQKLEQHILEVYRYLHLNLTATVISNRFKIDYPVRGLLQKYTAIRWGKYEKPLVPLNTEMYEPLSFVYFCMAVFSLLLFGSEQFERIKMFVQNIKMRRSRLQMYVVVKPHYRGYYLP